MQRTVHWAVQQVKSNQAELLTANQALEKLLRRDIMNDLFMDCAAAAVGATVCQQVLRILHVASSGGMTTTPVARTLRAVLMSTAAISGTLVFLQLRRVLCALGAHSGAGSPSTYCQLLLPQSRPLCPAQGGDDTTNTAVVHSTQHDRDVLSITDAASASSGGLHSPS